MQYRVRGADRNTGQDVDVLVAGKDVAAAEKAANRLGILVQGVDHLPDTEDPDRPTDKQLRYAQKLGIVVTPAMRKWDVSAAIAEYEKENPKAARQREHVKRSREVKKHGRELVEAEEGWNRLAEGDEYILAVYRQGKNIVVDVLGVSGAEIDGRGKLRLSLSAPKLRKDRYIGEYLEWDRVFNLPADKLLYSERLGPTFDDNDLDAYRKAVERGLVIAKRLESERGTS